MELGGKLYFTAANADDTGWELWRIDGDHSTKSLGDENGFALFPPVVYVNNGLMLFWGRQESEGLWAFDGTEARLVADFVYPDVNFDHVPYGFTSFNGDVYFAAVNSDEGPYQQLWKFDGTSVTHAPGIAPDAMAVA